MRPIAILCCALLLACSADRRPGSLFGPSEQGTIVVDALLIVDQPLPDLFVRQTLAPDVLYTQEAAAVRGAGVSIRQGDQTFRYAGDPSRPGRYLPPASPPTVAPGTEYRLLVTVGDREVRAITRTPGRIRIQEAVLLDANTLAVRRRLKTFADGPDLVFTAPENQVTYLDGLLEARFGRIDAPGYQIGNFSLDPGSGFVIRADFLSEEDFRKLKRQTSSPPLQAPDGSLRLPWFAIYFAGRHLTRIYAVDRNWYDFIRSSPRENNSGFGGLAGDNFERPLFKVEGGIGLFGSASVDSVGYVILPRPDGR